GVPLRLLDSAVDDLPRRCECHGNDTDDSDRVLIELFLEPLQTLVHASLPLEYDLTDFTSCRMAIPVATLRPSTMTRLMTTRRNGGSQKGSSSMTSSSSSGISVTSFGGSIENIPLPGETQTPC